MTLEEWIAKRCLELGVVWEKLTAVERSQILGGVPCSIRCWRVGVAIDVAPGEVCSECGARAKEPVVSRIDHILADG